MHHTSTALDQARALIAPQGGWVKGSEHKITYGNGRGGFCLLGGLGQALLDSSSQRSRFMASVQPYQSATWYLSKKDQRTLREIVLYVAAAIEKVDPEGWAWCKKVKPGMYAWVDEDKGKVDYTPGRVARWNDAYAGSKARVLKVLDTAIEMAMADEAKEIKAKTKAARLTGTDAKNKSGLIARLRRTRTEEYITSTEEDLCTTSAR